MHTSPVRISFMNLPKWGGGVMRKCWFRHGRGGWGHAPPGLFLDPPKGQFNSVQSRSIFTFVYSKFVWF